MKLGVCADPKFAPALADAGFDFIELNVQNHLKTMEDEAAFAPELARIQASTIPAIAANCFVPGSLKITGPEVNMSALENYVTVACTRAEQAGLSTIVFGSGGARRIPEDFDRDVAWQQLVAFGKLCGPIAQQHQVTIVVEPLNQRECNVLTSVRESGDYVREVDHPNVKLLADAYHWGLDDHDVDAIISNGHVLRHIHIATTASRVPPGFEPCDFAPFFDALKQAGYDGPISIEAKWDDMTAQAKDALVQLKALI
jgi:sugar phosphate isomerase/epimerase